MNRWHPLPAEIYALVEATPATVLQESAQPRALFEFQPTPEQFSRLFLSPLKILIAHDAAELAALFAEIEGAVAAGQEAAGYFAYECGNCFEPKAGQRPARAGEPLAWFGIYEHSFRFDHRTGAFLDGDPLKLWAAKKDCALKGHDSSRAVDAPQVIRQFNSDAPSHPFPLKSAEMDGALCQYLLAGSMKEVRFSLTEEQYADRIGSIHEWIRAGEIYQLNFTAPIQVEVSASTAEFYAELRRRQPVEFGGFLHCQAGQQILSFSPELFFQVEGTGDQRRITTRPMKGTAPRGRNPLEDRAQAEWLQNDPKNRSENVMIVDLLRNDLGRLCRFGSVQAESLFAVERHPTLWQMTSTVVGLLRPEIDFQQIFRALFPCGSITGAPKVRAMQLLAQIEPEPRGIYTGAIGYFSREKTVFNVAIRTLELNQRQNNHARMGVGSGIVIDSDAAEEFRECQLKAAFLTRSAASFPEEFSLVETLLWSGDLPLLELHLDRMEDSAAYFDFAWDRSAVREALLAYLAADNNGALKGHDFSRAVKTAKKARALAPEGSFSEVPSEPKPRKVRALLGRNGNLQISDEILPTAEKEKILRVCIAAQRTDSRDPMLFHKTTHRPLYASALRAAQQTGYDDVLFLNERDEVTESAIANIFIEKGGRWFTPPIASGLLAGVFRRTLLAARPGKQQTRTGRSAIQFQARRLDESWRETEIAEQVLSLDDLRKADAIYLANAVRGLCRAVVDWQADPQM